MRIVRVTNAQALQLPVVRALMREAMTGGPRGIGHRNPERAIDKIAGNLGSPSVAVWVGLEQGKPAAVLVCCLPPDPEVDWPMWDIGTSHGSTELRRAMVAQGIAFFQAAGYDKAIAINFSGHSDAAYIRMGHRIGLKLKKRASIMEVAF